MFVLIRTWHLDYPHRGAELRSHESEEAGIIALDLYRLLVRKP
jgi:hypothetical protein